LNNEAQLCGGVEGRSHWKTREPDRLKLQAHEESGAEPTGLAPYKRASRVHICRSVIDTEITYLFKMSILIGPLDEVLQDTVTPQARAEIIQHLWRDRRGLPLKRFHFVWDAYFAYYTRECNAALTDEGAHLCARSHRSLLRIAHLLEDAADEEEIRERLRQTLTTQRSTSDEKKMLDGSLKLATRIFTMISTGPLSSEISAKHSLPWSQGCSFADAVHEYFNQPLDIELDSKDDVVSSDLTCYNIERMSGIEVILTDNLLDHLRLVERDKKLCVFHHASFLRKMIATERYEHIVRPVESDAYYTVS